MGQDARIIAPLYINEYLRGVSPNNVVGIHFSYKNMIPEKLLMSINTRLSNALLYNTHPDIIHETYFSKQKILSKKCPRVITVYDMIHERYQNTYFKKDATNEAKIMSVMRADHVICISENTRKDLIDIYNIEESKTSTIHLGFLKATGTNATIAPHTTLAPFLLYVGNREIYKNFIPFIDAVSKSKKLMKDFNIIAFGGRDFDQQEKAIFSSYGYRADQIIHISGDDNILSDLYTKAVAFIFPSLYEGFGIPPLEAMAHGCPVVSSNTSSMPEVIGEAAEYFDPTSLESICEAIHRVVYSEVRKTELIEKGYNRIKSFSWDKCANETLSVYGGLV